MRSWAVTLGLIRDATSSTARRSHRVPLATSPILCFRNFPYLLTPRKSFADQRPITDSNTPKSRRFAAGRLHPARTWMGPWALELWGECELQTRRFSHCAHLATDSVPSSFTRTGAAMGAGRGATPFEITALAKTVKREFCT